MYMAVGQRKNRIKCVDNENSIIIIIFVIVIFVVTIIIAIIIYNCTCHSVQTLSEVSRNCVYICICQKENSATEHTTLDCLHIRNIKSCNESTAHVLYR